MNQAQQPDALRLADRVERRHTQMTWAEHDAIAAELRRLYARVQELEVLAQEAQEALEFVERWAVHHGTKPSVTAGEALSCIQHYPTIKAITKRYTDGKVPDTFDPFARIAELEGQQKREPLTNEQIGAILDKRDDIAERADGGGWHVLPWSFARAIERAHGITAQPEYHTDDERDHSDEDAAIAAGKVQAAVQWRVG